MSHHDGGGHHWLLFLAGAILAESVLDAYAHPPKRDYPPGWYKTEVGDQVGRDYYWDGRYGWYPGQPECPPWPFPWPIAYYGWPIPGAC